MREGCEVHTGDLRELDEARRATRGCSHVIHLAAIVGGIANFHRLPHTLTEVNNALASAVIRAALEQRVERFVYVSSSMVFERATEFPTPEDYLPDCPVPRSAYGFSKLTGEVYCRAANEEHGLPYTICRPFNAYGPGETPDREPGIAHAVPDLIAKALAGQRPLQIFGSGQQTRTLTHVDDIADGIVTRDELSGGPGGGLQHLRLARADRRRDRPHRVDGLRRGSRGLRARAPAELPGRRPAPLAVGREGPPAARLGGPGRPRAGDRRDRRLAARAGGPDSATGRSRLGLSHAMAVPLFDTATPLAPLRDRLRAAVEGVLDSGRYILGPEVDAFEREFAAYCGAPVAVGVANGTEAITIALRAMGVGPGDEVVVPSFTFYASAEAVPPTGATPVFCDVDPTPSASPPRPCARR